MNVVASRLVPLVVIALAAVLIVVSGAFGSLLRSFIYFPLAQEPPPVAGVLLGAEDVTFETADGLRLRAWFLPAKSKDATTVLVFHGNAGDRSHRAPLAEALGRLGYAVLLTDYRGYAGNAGVPTEDGLAHDARAALGYLGSRADVRKDRVAYFGESLGAAVAAKLATEEPPIALILRSPFTSLEDMARLHYAWLPIGPLLVERYPVAELVRQVKAPTLVIAGTHDEIVPLEHSRRVHDAAAGPKRFVVIQGADHNDLALLAGDEMVDAITSFLRESSTATR